MSADRFPFCLRDPNKPPAGLSGKSKRNWIRNAKRELQNYNYKCQYPPFYIPSVCYVVYHIHRHTQLDIMDIIFTHFQACDLFTINTESVGRPQNLALIQIQSIPVELPGFLLLVQLGHLPPNDSLLFKKIQSLFEIIFDKSKKIYSWGPLHKELQYATQYSLFSFPIRLEDIDIQSEFSEWYSLVPPYCQTCKPNDNTHITIGSSMFCECQQHAYSDSSKPWSLQNAILYATNCFLDKSQTENYWFSMLDPQYETISSNVLDDMINYAVYDCLSVTYLRLPVVQR
jgi:hypothetical protein